MPLFFSYLCGGECLEDINTLVGHFRQRPDTLLPGADTVGRGLKELSEEDTVYKSESSGMSYRFNTAEKLNVLLLRMIRRMGLIKVGSPMLTWTSTISSSPHTSTMQSTRTNRISGISPVGHPLEASSWAERSVTGMPM